tara:strand:+ start:740 stop:1423 length:684 start_codon:yes stop_codon:yes gene_type:complete
MKYFLLLSFFIGSFILSAQSDPYPCVKIDHNNNYIVTKTIIGYGDLDDQEFKGNMKNELVLQISSYIESYTTITSSNSLKNLRGNKKTNSISNMVANSVLNNPLIRVCGQKPELFVTMSITKSEYSKNVNTFFERKLKFASTSLSGLLKLGNIDNKKIYKEKISFYKNELSQITSLIPVVKLSVDIENLLDRFDRDLSMLENQYVVWKKNKGKKLSAIIDGVKDIFK